MYILICTSVKKQKSLQSDNTACKHIGLYVIRALHQSWRSLGWLRKVNRQNVASSARSTVLNQLLECRCSEWLVSEHWCSEIYR